MLAFPSFVFINGTLVGKKVSISCCSNLTFVLSFIIAVFHWGFGWTSLKIQILCLTFINPTLWIRVFLWLLKLSWIVVQWVNIDLELILHQVNCCMPKISRNTRNGWSVITKTSKWCRPSAIRIWRHCWRMSPGYVASPLSLLSNFFTQKFCQKSFCGGLKLQLLVFSFFIIECVWVPGMWY